MRFSGQLIRSNVRLPPAAGPLREQMLLHEGASVFRESVRGYAAVCRTAGLYLRDGQNLPAWQRTTSHLERLGIHRVQPQQEYLRGVWSRAAKEAHSTAWRHELGPTQTVLMGRKARTDAPDTDRYGLVADRIAVVHAGPFERAGAGWGELEEVARRSLNQAVDAFNFLEDSHLSDLAHRHAHEVAALTSGLFGCAFEYREGTYWDVCPVSLMHQRWGMSMGFTAIRMCSICSEDLDTCPHLLGTRYQVTVTRTDEGQCNVCGTQECPHKVGQSVGAYPYPVMADGAIHEVSMVSRPRDPLARLNKIEISMDLLTKTLGKEPTGQKITCYRCLHPCSGFTHPFETP
ncbi:hypothetical protein ABIA33_004638 [Streptacidiphilus sp. MAP12-16]|uniref:hypothetical protein n=1 Tax=Streptacidiphilus sp. MAP12-16 TaxID=3156300 RepID=UPI003519D1CA